MGIILRSFELADADAILEYLNEPSMHRFLADRVPFPYGYDRALEFVYEAQNSYPFICAIEYEGNFVGTISLLDKEDVYCVNLELGYWIGRPFWGKGIATEAIRQAVNIAFANRTIFRVYADLFSTNSASIRALEKNKFQLEGYFAKSLIKRGLLQDCVVYAINRDAWKENEDYFCRGGKVDA